MEDIDGQDNEFIDDDEIEITDLDPLDSSQRRRATLIMGVLRKGLTTRWIRYTLSGALILILLGALSSQWPRPAPAPASALPTPNHAFLNATTAQGLLFMQDGSFTLTAYSNANWHARWRVNLPAAASIQAQGSLLFCSFALPTHKTVLEALNVNDGKVIWHDVLPGVFTNAMQISRSQIIPAFFYANNTLYAQDTYNAVYAIQANSGRISWIYQAKDKSPGSLFGTQPIMPLYATDGVVEFMSTEAVAHVLDANTGREILSLSHPSFSWPDIAIDGQMLYILPASAADSTVQAFHISNGQRAWTYQLPDGTSVQTETDGVIYLSADAGATLIALRGSDAHELWRYHASDGQMATNTLFAENGVCYLLQQDATLVGIRVNDGHELWRSAITDFEGRINPTTFLFMDNGVLILHDSEPDTSLPINVISASDGHLLWRSTGPILNPYPMAGVLYNIGENGQIDAWRESDGQHLWRFDAPVGTSIWGLRSSPSLFFLQDATGNFYVLRTTDGKLLWRYP